MEDEETGPPFILALVWTVVVHSFKHYSRHASHSKLMANLGSISPIGTLFPVVNPMVKAFRSAFSEANIVSRRARAVQGHGTILRWDECDINDLVESTASAKPSRVAFRVDQ
jgi:hypothetical protein